MQRRNFIRLVGGAAVAWPLTVRAQQAQKPAKARRIAHVHSGIPADKLTETGGIFWVRKFYEELRRLGYAEGANLVVERFSAEGDAKRFAALVAAVVDSKPEVIVTNLNALTKAFTLATATIPIVAITTDPVAAGLVSSLAHPGANLTGVSVNAGPGIMAKRLQILKEAMPSVAKVALLLQAGDEPWQDEAALIAKPLVEVDAAQLPRAFAELAEQKFDAAIVSQGGSFVAQMALIVELAARHRMPVMYPYREYVELGGLIAYAPDQAELAKRMAADVHQILGGVKAGDIPYYLPTKFQLVINLKTAKALGLAIPFAVLAQADEVIE